jgi:hypothetical protein
MRRQGKVDTGWYSYRIIVTPPGWLTWGSVRTWQTRDTAQAHELCTQSTGRIGLPQLSYAICRDGRCTAMTVKDLERGHLAINRSSRNRQAQPWSRVVGSVDKPGLLLIRSRVALPQQRPGIGEATKQLHVNAPARGFDATF